MQYKVNYALLWITIKKNCLKASEIYIFTKSHKITITEDIPYFMEGGKWHLPPRLRPSLIRRVLETCLFIITQLIRLPRYLFYTAGCAHLLEKVFGARTQHPTIRLYYITFYARFWFVEMIRRFGFESPEFGYKTGRKKIKETLQFSITLHLAEVFFSETKPKRKEHRKLYCARQWTVNGIPFKIEFHTPEIIVKRILFGILRR